MKKYKSLSSVVLAFSIVTRTENTITKEGEEPKIEVVETTAEIVMGRGTVKELDENNSVVKDLVSKKLLIETEDDTTEEAKKKPATAESGSGSTAPSNTSGSTSSGGAAPASEDEHES